MLMIFIVSEKALWKKTMGCKKNAIQNVCFCALFFLANDVLKIENSMWVTDMPMFHLEGCQLQTLYTQMPNLCGFNSQKNKIVGVCYLLLRRAL
mmetsp:Transcript_46523/g.46996  ORF Transcript_46523/g.46996 Transcript_46523/m.46996 type:complete len:94 (-) Transcript_46523:89-370(-)